MNNFLTYFGCINTKTELLLVRSVFINGKPNVANLCCNAIVLVCIKANETCKIGGLTIILLRQEYDLLKLKIWCFLCYFVDLGTSQISPYFCIEHSQNRYHGNGMCLLTSGMK